MQGFKKRICSALKCPGKRLKTGRQQPADEKKKQGRQQERADSDEEQSGIPAEAVEQPAAFVVHFHVAEGAAVLSGRFHPAVKTDTVNMISKDQRKNKVRQFMNRRTDEIKKIQQKVSPGVPGKILPGGLSGTAHEEAEDHKHQQYFDIKLNKVIKHTDSLVENMAYHIINMRVLQESLLFYQTKTEKM